MQADLMLFPMYSHIHESNLIEDIDSIKADSASLDAWLWLIHFRQLDHTVICKLQKRLTVLQDDLKPNQRGYYRGMSGNDVFATVGGRVCPAPHMVKPLMDNWLLDFMTLDPIEAHVRFEKIHPFADGNGRTGRMLLWWQEYQLDRTPTLFLASQKHERYYPLFK